jgi:hypothetical protein
MTCEKLLHRVIHKLLQPTAKSCTRGNPLSAACWCHYCCSTSWCDHRLSQQVATAAAVDHVPAVGTSRDCPRSLMHPSKHRLRIAAEWARPAVVPSALLCSRCFHLQFAMVACSCLPRIDAAFAVDVLSTMHTNSSRAAVLAKEAMVPGES